MFKRIMVFDLDETIIDSKHRTPNHPDGTLNLEKYFAMKNRESIFRDSLLPLARFFKSLNRKENYIVICTARAMDQNDYDFLNHFGLDAHIIMCRPLDGSENGIKDPILKARKLQRLKNLKQFKGLPMFMWDDAKPVRTAIRQLGVACFDAIRVNERLA